MFSPTYAERFEALCALERTVTVPDVCERWRNARALQEAAGPGPGLAVYAWDSVALWLRDYRRAVPWVSPMDHRAAHFAALRDELDALIGLAEAHAGKRLHEFFQVRK